MRANRKVACICPTGASKRWHHNLRGLKMKKIVLTMVAIVLFVAVVTTAFMLHRQRNELIGELVTANAAAKKSASAASAANGVVKEWAAHSGALEKRLDACISESISLARQLTESQAKECQPKTAAPVVKKKAVTKQKAKKPDAIKAPKSLPLVAPPTVPTRPADSPAPSKPAVLPTPEPTALASAPCIADCAPRVTKSEPSKFCGLHVIDGAGYDLTLRLGRRGEWLEITEVTSNAKVRTVTSNTIRARQGDSCDALQTAVEHPDEWRGLAKYFKMPDGCTRRRVVVTV